jgi:WD40 repeat protein
MEGPSLGDLDEYTIQRIAEHLPTKELVRLSRTSRRIHGSSTTVMEQRHQAWQLQPIEEFGHLPAAGGIVAFSPEGQILTLSDLTGLTSWTIRKGNAPQPTRLMDLQEKLSVRALSPDGVLMACHDSSGKNYLIDRNTKKIRRSPIPLLNSMWNREAFSFDHQLFVGMTDQTTVTVVRLMDGVTIHQFQTPQTDGAIFSLHGDLLAYTLIHPTELSVHLRRLSTGHSVMIDSPDTYSINFSHDGRILVVGTNNDLSLYDVTDDQHPRVMVRHVMGDSATSVAFSPDDTFLVVNVFGRGLLFLRPKLVD